MNDVSNTSSFSNSSSSLVYFTSSSTPPPAKAYVGLFFAGMTVGLAISLAAVLMRKYSLRRKQRLCPEDTGSGQAPDHAPRLESRVDGSPIQPFQKYDHIRFDNENVSVERGTYEPLHVNLHLQESLPVYRDTELTVSHVSPFKCVKNHKLAVEFRSSNVRPTREVEPAKEQVCQECSIPICKSERQDDESQHGIYDQEIPNNYFILEKLNIRESSVENEEMKDATHAHGVLSRSAKKASIKLDLQDPVLQQSEVNAVSEELAYFILEKQENGEVIPSCGICNKETATTTVSDTENRKCGLHECQDSPENPPNQATGFLGCENNTTFPRNWKAGMHTTMSSYNKCQAELDTAGADTLSMNGAATEDNGEHRRVEIKSSKSKRDPKHEPTQPTKQPRKRKPTYTNIKSRGETGCKKDFEPYNNIEWPYETNASTLDTHAVILRSPTYQNVPK